MLMQRLAKAERDRPNAASEQSSTGERASRTGVQLFTTLAATGKGGLVNVQRLRGSGMPAGRLKENSRDFSEAWPGAQPLPAITRKRLGCSRPNSSDICLN